MLDFIRVPLESTNSHSRIATLPGMDILEGKVFLAHLREERRDVDLTLSDLAKIF
jgi:hypothetical protein